MSAVTLGFGLNYTRAELVVMQDAYQRLRDCLENRVKDRGEVYLPDPSEIKEDAKIRDHRYIQYHTRAVWLPVTKRTLQGLTAQVFIKRPVLNVGNIPSSFLARPSQLGTGVNAFARYALSEVIGMGRGAIVVHILSNNQPLLDFAETENIPTWSDLPYGEVDGLGRSIESVTVRGFSTRTLADDVTVEHYSTLTQFKLDKKGECYVRTATSPLNMMTIALTANWSAWQAVIVAGSPLKYVPVFPIGAERNTLDIEVSPLDELAALNISHYMNSADYEEHAKIAGQVTPVIKGLNQTWFDQNIKGKVAFGVRSPLPLPKEADAKLLQAQANSVAKEALDKKEKMMVSVGARLIEERSIRRTATEADIEDQSYHSILGHIAQNTSDAITLALRHVSRTLNSGKDDPDVLYTLNTDFSSSTSSAEHRRLLLEEYTTGVRSFEEYRKALQMFDQTLTLTANEAKTQILSEVDFRSKMLDSMTAKQQTSEPTPTEEK